MTLQKKQSPQISPKLNKFQKELTELQDRYQYNLVPHLNYTNSGIVPVLRVVERIPPDKPVKTPVKKKGGK